MQLMSSLQLEAYNYIKNLILTHQLDVNTLYSETKLSKELNQKIANGYLMYASWFKEEEK